MADLPPQLGAVGGNNGTGQPKGTGWVGKAAGERVQGRERYMALNMA